MLTRRNALRSLLAAPLVLTPFGLRRARAQQRVAPLDVRRQRQFVNPLPRPARATPATAARHYELAARQFRGSLGLIDPRSGRALETTLWGYDGQYPGPTFDVRRGEPVTVRWTNALAADGRSLPHLLPVDRSIHIAHTKGSPPGGVPLVTHLHGGHVEAASDGDPEAWFTPGFAERGPAFLQEVYRYANDQEAGTLWYHDHALGLTRLNVGAGLAGFYLVRDENEDRLGLPSGAYEIPLLIQDRTFTTQGELVIASHPVRPGAPDPSIQPEEFGTAIVVNGMVWPFAAVEARRYRLRLLNGSDSRFFALAFEPRLPFVLIGTDQGFLVHPVILDRLVLAPAERADVVVDFSHSAVRARQVMLLNSAPTPFPMGDAPDPRTTGRVMAFRVGTGRVDDASRIPDRLRPEPPPELRPTAAVRELVLFEGKDAFGRSKTLLGTVKDGAKTWHDPITEDPLLGAVEAWDLYNTTEDAHPIHVHLVHFRVVGHRRFADEPEGTGPLRQVRWLDDDRPPGPDERGPKDTVRVPPRTRTRIVARFDRPGRYVWHCHILSHEDHEMMRPFVVREG
jgi:spore coat protein A, manganese oxidase